MDSRLKKTLNAGGRESRSSQDLSRAAPEEAFISKQERRKMWSDEWTQSALPKVPDIPGWHLCWLSTTNGYDSIDKRMRLGYVPVRADELPGFDNYRVKAGEDVGFIACNEMRLYKLPMDVYQEVMTQMHHDAPNEESDKVQVQVQQLQGNRDSSGKSLGSVEGEGFGNLNRNVQTPVFHG
tara:strand:- start:161 stop:703 length:543 start_codon:yes stop_codon:yes gene_type:complete